MAKEKVEKINQETEKIEGVFYKTEDINEIVNHIANAPLAWTITNPIIQALQAKGQAHTIEKPAEK